MDEGDDPPVTALRYSVVATEPTTQSPAACDFMEFSLGGFSCRLVDGSLTAVPEEYFSSVQAAREAIAPFLRAWQVWSQTFKGVALALKFESADRDSKTEQLQASRVELVLDRPSAVTFK